VQKAALVIEDRFARLSVRIHFDPALHSKQARNPAKLDGLAQLLGQLAAWALRCAFRSDATRSDGWAPCPIQ
jgi:hypothetical protein